MKNAPDGQYRLVCACILVLAAVGAVAVVSGDATRDHGGTATVTCERDSYTPPDPVSEYEMTFVDPLENGSLADWRGGELVRVGGTGDCSLVVTGNESVTLTATPVDGTGGIVTGLVDLGANGSLVLVEENGTRETVAVSNQGPAFAHTYLVEVGNESSERALSTGRFVGLAVTVDNGTTQVALWDSDDEWDGEFDSRVENATQAEAVRLRLDGTAFVDGVAVGSDPAPEPTETPVESQADPEPDGPDPGDSTDESEFERFGPRDPAESGSRTESDDGLDGTPIFGLFLLVGGGFWFRYARGLARLEEQFDSIGSKRRWSEVEPAEWKVALNKLMAAGAVLFGVVLFIVGLLS